MTVEVRDRPPHTALALEVQDLTAGYGKSTVIRDVNMTLQPGTIGALLGPNGAGKTTLMRTLSGIITPSAGTVTVDGASAARSAPHQRARLGLCLIPEGRGVFRNLSVAENLRIQAPPWIATANAIETAVATFPVLGRRLSQAAGSLSGGEQQMLAISRAFMTDWKVVLLDELSMGLAPRVVDEIYAAIRNLAAGHAALLIVEQYVTRVLDLADHAFVLDHGSLSYSGQAANLDANALAERYLGVPDTTPAAQQSQ